MICIIVAILTDNHMHMQMHHWGLRTLQTHPWTVIYCPTRVTKHTFDTKSHPLIYIYFRSNALANLASMCMVIYAWEWLEDRSCFKSNTKHFKIHSVHDKSFGLLPYPLAFSPSFYSRVSGEAGAFFRIEF